MGQAREAVRVITSRTVVGFIILVLLLKGSLEMLRIVVGEDMETDILE